MIVESSRRIVASSSDKRRIRSGSDTLCGNWREFVQYLCLPRATFGTGKEFLRISARTEYIAAENGKNGRIHSALYVVISVGILNYDIDTMMNEYTIFNIHFKNLLLRTL